MATAWRITKARRHPYDGTGARLRGARWNSAGREVIYAADTFAGAILEILVHTTQPRTLAGRHHAVRIDVPDTFVETLEPDRLARWDTASSPWARQFGNVWPDQMRSVVLSVPSVPARPVGRTLLINPRHPDAGAVLVSEPFHVPWDERLF